MQLVYRHTHNVNMCDECIVYTYIHICIHICIHIYKHIAYITIHLSLSISLPIFHNIYDLHIYIYINIHVYDQQPWVGVADSMTGDSFQDAGTCPAKMSSRRVKESAASFA